MGPTLALEGDTETALEWKSRLEQSLHRNPSGAIQLAMIAASLDRKDEAIHWLEKAFEAGSWF